MFRPTEIIQQNLISLYQQGDKKNDQYQCQTAFHFTATSYAKITCSCQTEVVPFTPLIRVIHVFVGIYEN